LIFNLFGIFRQNINDLPLKEYIEPEDYQRFLEEADDVLTEYGKDPRHIDGGNTNWKEYWSKRKQTILESI
jgi:hypothetical protein